jgi:hypothetical protein
MRYIKKVWRGEERLWVTFWIYYITMNFATASATDDISVPFIEGDFAFLVILVIFVVWLISQIFMLVAIWRSASKYEGKIPWGNICKFVLVAGLIAGLWASYTDIKNAFDPEYQRRMSITKFGFKVLKQTKVPLKIGKDTTLVEVFYSKDALNYRFEVDDIFDKVSSDMFIKSQKIILAKAMCKKEPYSIFFGLGGSYIYEYHAKNDIPPMKFKISLSDCKKNSNPSR